MLQYISDVGKAIQGLGMVVDNQAPLLRMAVKNWPITGLILFAWGTRIYHRYKNKELSVYTALLDSGAILGPAVALMVLAHLAKQPASPGPSPATVSAAIPTAIPGMVTDMTSF